MQTLLCIFLAITLLILNRILFITLIMIASKKELYSKVNVKKSCS